MKVNRLGDATCQNSLQKEDYAESTATDEKQAPDFAVPMHFLPRKPQPDSPFLPRLARLDCRGKADKSTEIPMESATQGRLSPTACVGSTAHLENCTRKRSS